MSENADPPISLDALARTLEKAAATDVAALSEVRNTLAMACAEPPICDQLALTTLAERALAALDGILTSSVKQPSRALAKAVKLLKAAAEQAPKSEAPPEVAAPPTPPPAPSIPPESVKIAPAPPPQVSVAATPPAAVVAATPPVATPPAAPPPAAATPAKAAPAVNPNLISFDKLEDIQLVSVPPYSTATLSEPPKSKGAAAPADAEEPEGEPPDPELLQEFVAEASQYLADAEAALLRLESNPTDADAIGTVFRGFHTIKGVSAFLGLPTVTSVAHSAESLLSRMRDGELPCSGGYASLALSSIDALKSLVSLVARGTTPKMTPALEALSERLLHPEAHGIRATAAEAALAPAQAQVQAQAQALAQAEEREEPQGPQVARAETVQESWIRVRTDRLDRLIDMVGELVIAQSMVTADAMQLDDTQDGLQKKVGHAAKIIRELQDLSMSLRMVPLRQTFQKVARVVRDVGQKSGRAVQFVTDGDDTEIDRNMVEVLADPLIHMARNAVDHGLEPSAGDRQQVGKSPHGNVKLVALRSGGEVVLQLSDDGRGIDPARVAAKAIERGIIGTAEGMTEAEVLNLIFEPGFSTRDEVTDISGRGVGMDVVKRGVEALKGRIEISSKIGEGTTFSLRLPLTLAITDGMLVRVGSERYVIPSVGIRLSLRPDPQHLSTIAERGEFLRLRGELIPICRLHHLFNIAGAQEDPANGLLVVVNEGSQTAAVLVDEVLGQQQVVTKSLGGLWGPLPGIAGGAILGDGKVGLILDLVGVAGLSRQRSSFGRPRGLAQAMAFS